ncbi:MAG: FecR family protein [Desulfovibrio sp.]|nr:FecR family protein [Desulfovibrio sp.]
MSPALNDTVRGTDRIITDATGRARILFHDDGAVSLGPNTSLDLIDVMPEGDAPVFKAHVAQGLARFITGKIVEQNPKGFSVSTPEGTAGIRGTIFVLQTGNGRTTIYVSNATRDVTMSGVSVPSGFKMTLPGGNPVPMTPQDVSFTQNIAAAPPSSRENGTQRAPEQTVLAVLDESGPLTPTALAGLPVNDLATPPLMPTAGTVTGTLSAPAMLGLTTAGWAWASWNGSFSFDADLTRGTISNAAMHGAGMLEDLYNPGNFTANGFNVSGGGGSIAGAAFSVDGFSGSVTIQDTTFTAVDPSTTGMTGTIQASGSAISANGNYSVGESSSYPGIPWTGAFSGTGP